LAPGDATGLESTAFICFRTIADRRSATAPFDNRAWTFEAWNLVSACVIVFMVRDAVGFRAARVHLHFGEQSVVVIPPHAPRTYMHVKVVSKSLGIRLRSTLAGI